MGRLEQKVNEVQVDPQVFLEYQDSLAKKVKREATVFEVFLDKQVVQVLLDWSSGKDHLEIMVFQVHMGILAPTAEKESVETRGCQDVLQGINQGGIFQESLVIQARQVVLDTVVHQETQDFQALLDFLDARGLLGFLAVARVHVETLVGQLSLVYLDFRVLKELLE